MPELQLIGSPFSNFVWVCRLACAEKAVSYTLISASPHTPEVDQIHPLGKIPVMRHGTLTLCESKAICFYIERSFDGPALVPSDPADGARTEQWISIVNTAIDPLWVRQYFREYVFPTTPDGSPNRAVIDATLPKMAPQFAMLDRAVAATGHLVGSRFTLADVYLLPILHYMSKVPQSAALLARATHLSAYLERHRSRPTLQETTPPLLPERRAA